LQDLKTAMREKDTLRRDMLQISRAAILQTEKDTLTELDEAGVIALIAKEVKKREELLADLENSGRQDIIDRTNAEIAVFKAYLPEQMDETQVEEIVRNAIAATGAVSARDMGMVMKAVIPEIAGRADNKLVNQVVRRLLA